MTRKLVSIALFFASGSSLALSILPREVWKPQVQEARERKGYQPAARSRPPALLAKPKTRPPPLRDWGPTQRE